MKEKYTMEEEVVLSILRPEKQTNYMKDLVKKTGFEANVIRSIIRALRSYGEPICSSSKDGYFLGNFDDLMECSKYLELRGKAEIETSAFLRKTANKIKHKKGE